jgi:hypothetical protein
MWRSLVILVVACGPPPRGDDTKDNQLIRIKAGPSSGVLVVNKIEICIQ